MHRYNPIRFFLGLGLILTLVVSALLWRLGLGPVYAYLVGINTVTLLLYGFDKRQAVVHGPRVPEIVLHAASLPGGTPGALVGQVLFRHKTQKQKFRIIFGAIVLLQIAVAYGYWRFVQN